MSEVVLATPTIVFGARDPEGRDVFAVRLVIDGTAVTSALDGRAMPLDPGKHHIRLEAEGFAPVEQDVLMREGEKDRQLILSLAPSTSPPHGALLPSSSPERAPAPAPTPATTSRPIPPLALVAAGVGIAGLGVATFFDIKGTSDALALKDRCSPQCASSEVDPIRTEYLVARVAAGVTLIALGAAAILYFTRPSRASVPAAATFDGLRVAF
jgi:hypothetical protein